jgi:uncharacterized protein YjiS (DUF1127 family)
MMFTLSQYRKNRLKHYVQVRRDLENLTEQDLADIGLKRYQLGHAARVKALG